VLALLRGAATSLRHERALEILKRTATPVHGAGHHPSTGFGVVDAARAFEAVK